MELPTYACHACVARVVMFVANFRKIMIPADNLPVEMPRFLAKRFAPAVLSLCNEPEELRSAATAIADATIELCGRCGLTPHDVPDLRIELSHESVMCLVGRRLPSLARNLERFLAERRSQPKPFMEEMLSDRALMVQISRYCINRRLYAVSRKMVHDTALLLTRGDMGLYNPREMRRNPRHLPSWLGSDPVIGKMLMSPNDPTYEVLLKLLKQGENISEMMSQVLDKQSANTIQQPARQKRKIERYSISISEASLICETSERTFARRMEESIELRHLMHLKPAAACRKAVRQWWDVYVNGNRAANAAVRAANRPIGGR